MTVSWSGFEERPDMVPAVQVEDAPDVYAADVAALGMALPASIARCKEAGYLDEAARLCRDVLKHDPCSCPGCASNGTGSRGSRASTACPSIRLWRSLLPPVRR